MESTVVPAPGPRHRFDGRGVRALLLPFVAMGALVIVAAAAVTVGGGAILGFGDGTAVIRDPLTFGIGAGIAVGTIILGIVIAGRHLPAWVDAGPLVLSVVAVAFMRDGTGGGASGFTPLFLVPVLWVALYDSRRQLAIVLVAVLLALVVPIIAIGGDEYPTAELRRMTVFMGVALLIGVTVQNLVDRMRAAIAGEAARSADVAAQEARLRAILDTASDAVITLEPGGRIVDLNPAAIDMLRGGREALIGRNLIETLADDDAKDQLRAGMDGSSVTAARPRPGASRRGSPASTASASRRMSRSASSATRTGSSSTPLPGTRRTAWRRRRRRASSWRTFGRSSPWAASSGTRSGRDPSARPSARRRSPSVGHR